MTTYTHNPYGIIVLGPNCRASPDAFADEVSSGLMSEDGASDSSRSSHDAADDRQDGPAYYRLIEQWPKPSTTVNSTRCLRCTGAAFGSEESEIVVRSHGGVMRCQGSLDRRVVSLARGNSNGFAVIKLVADRALSMASANVAVLAAMRDAGCCEACVNKGSSFLAHPWRLKPTDKREAVLSALMSRGFDPISGLPFDCYSPHFVIVEAAAQALCANLDALHRASLWGASLEELVAHAARSGGHLNPPPTKPPMSAVCVRLFHHGD